MGETRLKPKYRTEDIQEDVIKAANLAHQRYGKSVSIKEIVRCLSRIRPGMNIPHNSVQKVIVRNGWHLDNSQHYYNTRYTRND